MNSQRQSAYLNLIRALLECPSGQEPQILNANRELLDAGLVEVMEQAAVVMAEKGYQNEPRFLRSFASGMAANIGYSSPVSSAEIEESLKFLLRVVNEVISSNSNPQVVFPLLIANLNKLDRHLAQILRVWAKLSFPLVTLPQAQTAALWIAGFGALVKDFPQGDRASNLEIVIATFESSLQVLTGEDFPRQWSAIQNDLGNAYRERIDGDKSENIKEAIACYQLALQVRTKSELPELWAMTQFNLGQAYIERIEGDRTENLERAIVCYENALQIYTPNKFPKQATMAQNNLEVARRELRNPGLAESPEQAIQPLPTLPPAEQDFLIEVLRAIWRNERNVQIIYPLLQANISKLDSNFAQILRIWATNALGRGSTNRAQIIASVIYHFSNLMQDFPLGNRAANLEIAITGYELVGQVYSRENFPQHWAELQIHLGIAYEERLNGNQAEKWEQAIACYENAARVYTRESSPQQWAMVQENLGNAYRNRVYEQKKENLELAIAYHKNALQVRNRETFPQDWAVTINNLASAYLVRVRGDGEENCEKAIAYYEESLQVLTREAFPEKWAMTQMSLGNAYGNRLRGNPIENRKQAIEHYENALQVYTVEAYPYLHEQVLYNFRLIQLDAINSTNIASTLSVENNQQQDNPFLIQVLSTALHSESDPQVVYPLLEANLEKLDSTFAQQLRDYGLTAANIVAKSLDQRSAVPSGEHYFSLVKAIIIFCNSIHRFPAGNKATNLEIEIAGYESVLQLFTREKDPEAFGALQCDMGRAYHDRYKHRLENRYKNLELAIDCYKKGLEVLPRQDLPEQWAAYQSDLGLAYHRRIKGDQAENKEAAIHAYTLALQVYKRETYPLGWADAQNNLGLVYQSRYKGIEAKNLELAIACYNEALDVFTREAFPDDWATVQMNLASAYVKRSYGNPIENLEKSIKYCNNSLQVRTRENFPQGWADIQVYLGIAYYRRGLLRRDNQDGAEYFEQSIQCYENALEVWTRDSYPEEWANIKQNLGVTYSDRINGERADNLELSIKYLEDALQVCTHDFAPYKWADIQRDLAVIYPERILGKREENLELAIIYSDNALKVFIYESAPTEWARTQWNLGTIYKRRIYGEPIDNLEKAIFHYKNAVQVFTCDTNKRYWGHIQFELGTCYKNLSLYDKDHEDNLEKAIEHYVNALRVNQREISPSDWAELQNSLGNAYRHRIKGDENENRKQAIACFEKALQVRTQSALPKNYVRTLSNMGNLYIEAGDFIQAYDTFKKAIETVESLRSEITSSDEAKRKLAEEWNQLYQWMVKVCLERGKKEPEYYALALEYADRSKARNLLELLNTKDIIPKGQIPETLWNELQRLQRRISAEQRILEDAERLARSEYNLFKIANPRLEVSLPDRTKLNQLQEQFNQGLAEAKRIDASFSMTIKVEAIPFKGIRGLIPDDSTVIIEWYILEAGQKFCTFIFTRQSLQPIVWESTLKDLEDLQQWNFEYLTAYQNQKDQWQSDLDSHLQRLAEILHIDQILALLPSTCKQVILIPHRYLHLFSIHALPISQQTRKRFNPEKDAPTNPCLLDCFETGVRYSPSCQALMVSQNRKRTNFNQLFAIQNPTGDLSYADLEVEAILSYFDSNSRKVLCKTNATKTNSTFAEHLNHAHCIHFSCHGTFNAESPLESGLLLANNEILTLGEIFGLDLRQCRLVVLSACETGLTDFGSISDEYLGLPSGFLSAGSLSVVSTLWSVYQDSAAFLTIKLYENMIKQQDNKNVAVALKEAQLWLRDVTKKDLQQWISELCLDNVLKKGIMRQFTQLVDSSKPFASPVHWAAFCSIGQ